MEQAYLARPDSALAVTQPVAELSILRFGVVLGGAPVLLPLGVAAEYIAVPEIFPIPRAPEGLVGMIQLRGTPVAVFAGGLQASATIAGNRAQIRAGALVLGTHGQYGAVLISSPPATVELQKSADGTVPHQSVTAHDTVGLKVWLTKAIRYGVVDSVGAQWWELDLQELMQGLSQSGHTSAISL